MIKENNLLKDKSNFRKYIKNSDKFTDDDLNAFVTKILSNNKVESVENDLDSKDSPNKKLVENQQRKCLKNYEKYQEVWYQNIQKVSK